MSTTSDRRHGCRVSDEWTFRGMRMALLENDHLRVLVALDRGGEIVEFRSIATGVDPLLRLPGGPRDPRSIVPSVASAGGGFLDAYAGGWQEIAPNGGPSTTHRGAEYGQHGEISLVPWSVEVLEDSPERVTIACRVRAMRTPFLLERRMTLRHDRAALFLDERLVNESPEPLDLMWGHHIAFGAPFLGEGSRIWTSARRVVAEEELPGFAPRRVVPGSEAAWPVAPAVVGGTLDLSLVAGPGAGREMCYLSDFDGPAWYAITGAGGGFAVRWDTDVFRYLWLWQELATGTGSPWWGRVYTVALEPWTSFPTLGLAEAVRRGTQLVVPARGTIETSLVAVAFDDDGRSVTGVEADGTVVCGVAAPAERESGA